MIGHDDIISLGQVHVGTQIEGFIPFVLHDLPYLRQNYGVSGNSSEVAMFVNSADRHNIGSTPAVLPEGGTGGGDTILFSEFLDCHTPLNCPIPKVTDFIIPAPLQEAEIFVG